MDDQRIGAVCRALRMRLGWRQVDLAGRVGCHQTTISRIERGDLDGVPQGLLRRVFAALGARFNPDVWWRGGELDRLLDEEHAGLEAEFASILSRFRWQVLPEASFSRFGERGSIDVLGIHPIGAAAVSEIKSGIGSVEETHRRHDVKVRNAGHVVFERAGRRPTFVGRILVLPDTTRARSTVARYAAIFDAAHPARARELARWLREPNQNISGIWFLSRNREGIGKRKPRRRVRARTAVPRTKQRGQATEDRPEPTE